MSEQTVSKIGDYQVFRLLPNDPFSRELMPKVYARACEFIDRYSSQTDKVWLGALLFQNFQAANNMIHVLVALDGHGAIVAHSISYVDRHESLGSYVQIMQVVKEKFVSPEIMAVGHMMIDEWTRALGLKIQMNNVVDRSHERLYRRFGFSHWRTTLQRRLPEEGVN